LFFINKNSLVPREEFDRLTKAVIDSVHKKRGYDPHNDSKNEIAPLRS